MNLDTIQFLAGAVLMMVGLAFMLIGSIGILRLPDFFSRTHAASKVDTVGIIVLLVGIAVVEGATVNSAKILVAIIFLCLTNPVAAHALARAALALKIKPWTREEKG